MDEEKFIQRVEKMLFETCGCTGEEALVVLKKCSEKIEKNWSKYPHFRNDLKAQLGFG